MISSAVLGLREGLEAALIVGILIGILKKFNLNQFRPILWAGVASASVASLARRTDF
jgi:high-affinity iron transporter